MHTAIEIHDPLCHYLSQSSPGYAVMINGVWGSGKSFYAKNTLQQHTKKQWVYVSLFGLSSTEQIDDAIGSSLLTLPDSGLLKESGAFLAKYFGSVDSAGLAGTIAAAAGKWTRNAVLESIGENHVLVLDDLERFDREKISDALAVGSRYAEIQGASVIFVGDLTKLDNKQLAYEEKAVRYTYEFNQSFSDVWAIGVEAFKKLDNYYRFLKKMPEDMGRHLEIINCTNIRTVMVALGAVELLFNRKRSMIDIC